MTFGYGALAAQGRLEWLLGVTDKQYKNNPTVTENLSVSTVDTAARFYYRIGPRTRLLSEARYTTFSYDTGRFSNDEVRLLGGFTWDLTSSTSGTVKAGFVRKNFEQTSLADYSAFTAEAAFRYLLRSYSVFEVAAGRSPSDFYGTGYFNVDTYISTAWNHRWASYLSTRVTASYLSQEIQGANRTDSLSSIGAGGYFDIRPWLRLGIEVQHSQRSSDDALFVYSRNLVMLTIGATL
jgi:hypothetical protein